ncbi:hypothetical protein NOM01_04545 [Sporolactobacillus sp. STSJ-5]|uniref:hypothetical protein n=1 Tax=Sporolactobacillus sp. STSJ-5 TaxID=2965076 RepID=UPI002107FB5B|nr:hypothetical protein [Sporolactobacillus sp. STSJ-5]MCQ2009263.1 hypothetical protein [Sporolactobacillus sp. STSJ-5]
MEKTITVSGKQVRLKTSGAFPLRFKAQFHKDYFKELTKLVPLLDVYEKVNKSKSKKSELQGAVDAIDLLDFDLLYNIVWTMAKTADPKIPEPFEWLDQFESFPIIDVLPQVQEMLTAMITTEKNSLAANQAANH